MVLPFNLFLQDDNACNVCCSLTETTVDKNIILVTGRRWALASESCCCLHQNLCIFTRVSHNTHFFELSYALLISHAIGLEEATKKIFSVIDSKMAFSERFSFLLGFLMGKRPDFEYHVGK